VWLSLLFLIYQLNIISLRFPPPCHIWLLALSYRCVWHAIVVGVVITHVANAVMVRVFLSRIRYPHAIVLCPETNKTRSLSFSYIEQFYCTNLFTPRVIACQIDVRPSIQIQVWSAYFAVSSPAHDTLKYRTTMSIYYFITILFRYYNCCLLPLLLIYYIYHKYIGGERGDNEWHSPLDNNIPIHNMKYFKLNDWTIIIYIVV